MTLKDGTVVSKDQVSVLLTWSGSSLSYCGSSNFRPILRFDPMGVMRGAKLEIEDDCGVFVCSELECQHYSGFRGAFPCPFAINVNSVTPETVIVKPMNLEQFEKSLDMTVENLAILSKHHSENGCHEEEKFSNFFFLIRSEPFNQQCDISKYGTRIIRDRHGRIMVCLNVKKCLGTLGTIDQRDDEDDGAFDKQFTPDDIYAVGHWSSSADCGSSAG